MINLLLFMIKIIICIRGWYRNLIWTSVLTWASLCDANFVAGGFEGRAMWDPTVIPPILLCIISRFASRKHLFCWQLVLILPYSSYCFSYFLSYENCSRWVSKLSNDACPLNLVPNASFLMQSNWLEKRANQYSAMIPTKTVVRC